jgi:hypothetical protein
MKVKVFQALERIFAFLGKIFTAWSERCALCPDCGRNRYTGQSCIVMRGIHDCD